jgi:histidyl-tRNA synthetase
MFGGGRYDGLVGLFGVDPVPTAGFAMGDVTLQYFLEVHELLTKIPTETDAYVLLIGDIVEKALPAVSKLRSMGLNLALDFTGRKVAQQIKTADKKGVHYIIAIGEKELADEQYTLKNLLTGNEERHSAERIVSIVRDYRKTRLRSTPNRTSDTDLLLEE